MHLISSRTYAFLTMLVACGTASAQPSGAIQVRIDRRVELLSIVFRLAGSPEYNQPSSKSPYSDEVAKHFEPVKDHDVVKLAQSLRRQRGVSYDAVMSYAVHLKEAALEPKIPYEALPARLDKRWRPEDATKFLSALRDFVSTSKADEFFAAHREFYDRTAQRLAAELTKRPYRAWLDSFFGAKPKAKFTAIIGLLNGGGSYGSSVRYADGSEEILPIIGPGSFGADGPVFGRGVATLLVHEFCHSYTNPLVEQFADQLMPSARKIFPHRKVLMAAQAYGTPETMMYECLVRACTVRFSVANDSPKEAARQLAYEQGRGFLWTSDLSELLGQYEKQRDRYATLEAFMPEIVKLFEQVATNMDKYMARLPKIVSMSPANAATNVDPSTSELRIEFDRPMNKDGFSFVGDPKTTPAGARTEKGNAKPRFSDDGKVLTWKISLEPGKKYAYALNSIYFTGFQSAEGYPMDPVPVTFTTIAK